MREENPMRNEELKEKYNKVYKEGEEAFFSKFLDGQDISEANRLVLSAVDWKGKRVLDVGCGAGHLAAHIAALGAASVTGIDYAQEAVNKANVQHVGDNLKFRCMPLEDWTEPVDYIVSMGTLEHMDSPATALKIMTKNLREHGKIILTCPCFINLRGFVWMTLQLLQNVPMSLTDIHFLSPFDIEALASEADLILERVDSCDYSKGNGEQMLTDLKKRLTNALRDAKIDSAGVDALLVWLEKVSTIPAIDGGGALMGATGFYLLGLSQERPTAIQSGEGR